jgi:protein-tyrosine phosphatase
MAAAIMARRAGRSGSALRTSSAGFTEAGRSSPDATVRVMAERGIDLTQHRSRVVTVPVLDGADLVLGMTRAHVWDAALLAPDVLERAFVIGEIVRMNRLAGGREPGEKFVDWVARLFAVRQHALNSIVASDEVLDPFGRPRRHHGRAARQIEERVLDLVDCAFDPAVPLRDTRWREGRLVWHP